MNIFDIILICIVISLLGMAVKKLVQNKKNKGDCLGCGGNCGGCNSKCHYPEEIKKE